MARKFDKMTSLALRQLKAGEKITEDGITFERLKKGDGRFTINVMVDGQRIHRVVGCESDGTTRTQAEEYIERVRQDAKHDRLSLPKGRKVEMAFAEATQRYLDELGRANGKDLEEKRRRLMLHLIPYFCRTPLSRIDSVSVERYKAKRRNEPTPRGGVR